MASARSSRRTRSAPATSRRRQWGVAVQSKFLAVGCIVPWAEPLVGAVATQSWANPRYGPDGLALLREGLPAEEVVTRLTEADDKRAQRQLGVVDGQGRGASYTGEECHDWAGHRTGSGLRGAGQHPRLRRRRSTRSRRRSRRPPGTRSPSDSSTASMPRRLREATAAASSRRRSSSSGPEQGFAGLSDVFVDLRVDDHPRPLEELRRLFGIHQELFGKTPRDKWIEVDDELRKELADRLAVLGFERLEDWAGVENLEERVDGDDAIDPFVLDRLREASS